MEHIEKSQAESDVLYIQVASAERAQYDAANETLSYENYLQEIESASWNFITNAQFILKCVDSDSANDCSGEIKLCTHIAEQFYNYAVDGMPAFLYVFEKGVKRELSESEEFEFGMLLSAFLAYNELFTSLEESMGGSQPAYGMKVVLNMFFARLKLDAALYSEQEQFLSIAEVALLARMKEKSVRNFAHRSLGAQHDPSRRITLISAKKANEWLLSRRKFTPSVPLTTEFARQTLVSIRDEFG